MSQPNNSNPFMFPGLGQQGDLGQNPMLTSIEMMRQAWDNLTQAGASQGVGLATPPMNIEDLDRRIAELRTVENWLRMNLSMLTSTIQGLEVQRATISTLRSFVSPEGMSGNGDNPSALEVALGLKPSGQAKIKPASAAAQDKAGGSGKKAGGASQGDADASAEAMRQGADAMQQGSEAAQAWWSMLQNQFNTLASTTSGGASGEGASGKADGYASASAAQAAAASASPAAAKSTMSSDSAPKRAAASRARKQTSASTGRKSGAARKTASRKRTVARKTSG